MIIGVFIQKNIPFPVSCHSQSISTPTSLFAVVASLIFFLPSSSFSSLRRTHNLTINNTKRKGYSKQRYYYFPHRFWLLILLFSTTFRSEFHHFKFSILYFILPFHFISTFRLITFMFFFGFQFSPHRKYLLLFYYYY